MNGEQSEPLNDGNNVVPSNDIQTRLFNLRMKINAGRKANTAEVQEEVV